MGCFNSLTPPPPPPPVVTPLAHNQSESHSYDKDDTQTDKETNRQ